MQVEAFLKPKESVGLWTLLSRWEFLHCNCAYGKAAVYNARDPGSIPGLGRSPGEGNGNPLQYYCLENPMDRGAWQATVYGVAKSQIRLSDFTSFWEDTLEKEMAIHSSTIVWKIPGTEEPGKLQSMESQRVRHD